MVLCVAQGWGFIYEASGNEGSAAKRHKKHRNLGFERMGIGFKAKKSVANFWPITWLP